MGWSVSNLCCLHNAGDTHGCNILTRQTKLCFTTIIIIVISRVTQLYIAQFLSQAPLQSVVSSFRKHEYPRGTALHNIVYMKGRYTDHPHRQKLGEMKCLENKKMKQLFLHISAMWKLQETFSVSPSFFFFFLASFYYILFFLVIRIFLLSLCLTIPQPPSEKVVAQFRR